MAQQRTTVTGAVVDAQGQPLAGATVLEKGYNNVAITDVDGHFTISVSSSDAVLQFEFIGYKKTEKPALTVNLSSPVYMEEDDRTLDEVVVIGYGTMRKEDKTGAVASVASKELHQGIVTSTVQAIQGKAAGVMISKNGGDPNAGFSVKIRGQAGLSSGTDPLYVIDGVPGADPNTIAPSDIESFSILKDASSTSIYGTRGANGVIIITTKKGLVQETTDKFYGILEVNSNMSVDVVAKRINLLSADDYRNFASQKYGSNFIDGGADTNWQDEIFRTGITSSTNVAFSAGNNKTSYRVSATFNDFQGVINNSSRSRGTGLINVIHNAIDNRLHIEAGLSAATEQNHWIQYNGNGPRDVLYQAFQRNPTDAVYNADGSYYESTRGFQYYNPVSLLNQVQDDRDQLSLRANLNAKFEIWDGLKAGVNTAYIRTNGENGYYIPTTVGAIGASGNERQSQRTFDAYTSALTELTLSYDKTFDIHTVNAVAGYSYEHDMSDGFNAQGRKSQSDYMGYDNLGALTVVNPGDISSYRQKWNLISFFGRVAYNFDSRYYLTVTLRRDGSSKFGENKKWGFFPSASVAWNITREGFMSDMNWLSMLKLRAGAGKTGNQDIPPYMSLTTYAVTGTTTDPETGETVVVLQGNRNPNPYLKWEENMEYNIGLDFGLLQNRISGSFEFYLKRTQDLLASYAVPTPPNQYGSTFANGGSIDNIGFEATIQAWLFNTKDFLWNTSVVFSTNKQKLVSLVSSDGMYGWDNNRKEGYVNGRGLVGGENYTQIVREGEALGTFWLPEFAGFSQDGAFLYKTAAGGVTRDITKAQRYNAGSAQPLFELGWSNYFTFFKNFDASFSLRAVVGHKVFNGTEMYFGNPFVFPSLNGTYKARDLAEQGINSNPNPSDYYLEDATFLRLDDLTIGYNIPFKANKYIQKARVYFTGNNLLTLTGYSGLDPEVSYNGLSYGVENYNVYPKVRSFIFGVQLQF